MSSTIQLSNGEVLIPDADFCRDYLNGATRRTGSRYDGLGLPFVMVNRRKMRPLNRGKAWIASRIISKPQPQRGRRAR
jgi:hypothetical protein